MIFKKKNSCFKVSLLKPTISPIFRCKDIHSSSILYDIFNNLDIYEQSGYIQISDARISILLQSSTTFSIFQTFMIKVVNYRCKDIHSSSILYYIFFIQTFVIKVVIYRCKDIHSSSILYYISNVQTFMIKGIWKPGCQFLF